MPSLRPTTRAASALLGAVTAVAVALVLAPGPAAAAPTSSATTTETATSGSWGAAAAANGTQPTGADFVLNWTLTGSLFYQYFQVVNTGSLNAVAETYTAVNSKPKGPTPPTIGLDACVGAAWNMALGTCAGTVFRLTASNQSATAATTAIAAGGSLSVRAAPTTQLNFPQPYTTSITVAMTRAQARPSATYNT